MVKPQTLLSFAHWAMALCLLVSLGIVYLVYISDVQLSIAALIALHIALIIFPGIFKLGYVVRLTALKQLGRPVN